MLPPLLTRAYTEFDKRSTRPPDSVGPPPMPFLRSGGIKPSLLRTSAPSLPALVGPETQNRSTIKAHPDGPPRLTFAGWPGGASARRDSQTDAPKSSGVQNGNASISLSSFQNVAQARGPDDPGNGVSRRTHVSPGRAPVWSEDDGKTMPGVCAKEHTQPAEGPVRRPCSSREGNRGDARTDHTGAQSRSLRSDRLVRSCSYRR